MSTIQQEDVAPKTEETVSTETTETEAVTETAEATEEAEPEEVAFDPAPCDAPTAGSTNAANQGVQQDASGHFTSTEAVNSDKSGTRI